MKLKSLLAPVLGVAFAASAFAGVTTSAKGPVIQQAPVENPLGITTTIGYDSNYVYRGINYGDNLVSAGIEGNIPLTDALSLTVGAWYGNLADDSFLDYFSYQELDLYAALFVDLGPVSIGAKYQYYMFEGDASYLLDDINEVGVLLKTSLGPVELNAGAYYDDTADGYYFEVGPTYTVAVTDRIGIEVGALVSYAVDYYGVDGFNHVKAWLAVPIKLTSAATLRPYIAGNLPVDALDDLGEDDRVYGGVSLSVSF